MTATEQSEKGKRPWSLGGSPTPRATRFALLLPSVLVAVVSCAGTPDGTTEQNAGSTEHVGSAEQGITCVDIQRAPATPASVEDAQVVTDVTDPTRAITNYGTVAQMNTGYVFTDYRAILVQFNLSAIPAGSTVSSATLTVRMIQSPGKAPVEVHSVVAPWSEGTVTWNSISSAFDPTLQAALVTLGVPNNTNVPIDITSLVSQWASGATPNHGVALMHPASGRTVIGSSEAPSLGPRPKLTVCYVTPTCSDGVQNGTETGVDCGGSCAACDVGAPSCSDTVQNGTETGVDCGGVACPTCADGQGCSTSADCVSGVCSVGFCVAPSCADGVKNGTETDLDCGGSCSPCTPTLACTAPADCASGWCASGKCSGYFSSCRTHKIANPAALSGIYPIDPDGAGPAAPFNVLCDQTTDGGGWTIAFNVSHTDVTSTLVATDPAYMHTDAFCPASGMSLGATFSCVSKLHAAGFESIAAGAEIMFYVVHADAPTIDDNPWLKTRLSGLKDLKAFLTHSRSVAQKCTDGTCNAMVGSMTNAANVVQNRWFAAGSPTRFVTSAAYMNNGIALSHMWHDSSLKRCNSDLDRSHYAVVDPTFADGFGNLPGVAYYRNGYGFDCFYSDVPARKISSRVMLRE